LVCGIALVETRIRWNLGEGRVLHSLFGVVARLVVPVRLILLSDLVGEVELGRCEGKRQNKAWMKEGRGSVEREVENVESS
jgi:hypothetical protein